MIRTRTWTARFASTLLAPLRCLIAAMLLSILGSGGALAAMVVESITVNGGSTANVAPGSPITVVVTVVLTNNTRWRSTSFTTTPYSAAINYCSVSPDISTNGRHSVSFTMNAPASQNVFNLNVVVDAQPSCNGSQASSAKTQTGAINTAPLVATLNHVRLQHDGVGLNCSPETITLRACADASCASPFTAATTVSLPSALGTWSPATATITGGQGTVTLSRSSGGTITLSGTVTSPTATNTAAVCYKNGVAGDCSMTFSDGSCSLDAVEPIAGPNTPIFTKRADASVVLDILTLNSGAVTNTRSGDVLATIVDASGGTCSTTALSNTVTLKFTSASNGRMQASFTPVRAAPNARIRLSTTTLTQCSSDNFAIRPSALTLSSSNASQDSTGASVTTASPLKAGTTQFALTATTTNGYTGTPSVAVERVAAADVATGVAGVRGTLSGVFGAASTIAPATVATAVGTGFRYTEVGYFKFLPYGVFDDGTFAQVDAIKGECLDDVNLGTSTAPADPNVAVGGKIGCYFGNAETGFFGRFIPNHFALGPDVTLTNRSALAACTAPGFTYMGEGMSVSVPLLAQSASNATTFNYTGRFNRFTPGTQMNADAINDPPPGTARTLIPRCVAPLSSPCLMTGVMAGSFADGEATIDIPLNVYRSTTPVGPFEFFKVGIAPSDADGVQLLVYDLDTAAVTAGTPNHKFIGASKVRYGRLNVDNAYGSELLNLAVRVTAQFWNGTGYRTNTDDSCSPLDSTGLTLISHTGGITTVNMPQSRLSAGSTLASGVGRVLLAKPAPAPTTKGSVVINSTSGYLPGRGRATFGLYKAGPVIYLRETY